MSDIFCTFYLANKGIGKARPRTNFQTGTIHTETNYGAWKDWAIKEIEKQMQNLPKIPKKWRVVVDCKFVNFFTSDSDNLTGAVLDAMKDAGFIKGDSSGYVAHSSGEFVKVRKKKNQPKFVGIKVDVILQEKIRFVEITVPDFVFKQSKPRYRSKKKVVKAA